MASPLPGLPRHPHPLIADVCPITVVHPAPSLSAAVSDTRARTFGRACHARAQRAVERRSAGRAPPLDESRIDGVLRSGLATRMSACEPKARTRRIQRGLG